MNVLAKAKEFVKLHSGQITGEIHGLSGPIAYKVQGVSGRIFHIYYSRRWYYAPDGISIPEHALEIGLKENATIVVCVIDEWVWQYASEWLRLSTIIKNTTYGGTMEKLIKKRDLLTGSFLQKPKKGMDDFL